MRGALISDLWCSELYERRQYCHGQVLSLIKRRTLALLRKEVEPVEQVAYARFLPEQRGHLSFETSHRRIPVEHVVPHLRFRHRTPHGGGRPGDRVGAEIDDGRSHAGGWLSVAGER